MIAAGRKMITSADQLAVRLEQLSSRPQDELRVRRLITLVRELKATFESALQAVEQGRVVVPVVVAPEIAQRLDAVLGRLRGVSRALGLPACVRAFRFG